MIQVGENLWVGNSTDERRAEVDAILNVAKDLVPTRGWDQGINYIHIGLVDGPGNSMETYYAAVLALSALVNAGGKVLVCCHEGKSSSMAVAAMYMHLSRGHDWDRTIEATDDVPEPNAAHRAAFDKMNWDLLRKITA